MTWKTPIFDRTEADVEYARAHPDEITALKGAYNYEIDLNRVEGNCQFIAEALQRQGYKIEIITKEDWTNTDWLTAAHWTRIRGNVEALKAIPVPEWREISAALDWANANALEWNLDQLRSWLELAAGLFRRSGTFRAGKDSIRATEYTGGQNWDERDALDLTWDEMDTQDLTAFLIDYRGYAAK